MGGCVSEPVPTTPVMRWVPLHITTTMVSLRTSSNPTSTFYDPHPVGRSLLCETPANPVTPPLTPPQHHQVVLEQVTIVVQPLPPAARRFRSHRGVELFCGGPNKVHWLTPLVEAPSHRSQICEPSMRPRVATKRKALTEE